MATQTRAGNRRRRARSRRAARRPAARTGAASRHGRTRNEDAPHRWSQRVTRTSDALDLEPGVFTRSPREIARSLQRSAERSTRRKSSAFGSAMSMLTFYVNRAGRGLPARRRADLEKAKDELRKLYGEPRDRA